jgi:RND family efflux transporter MFP subunit
VTRLVRLSRLTRLVRLTGFTRYTRFTRFTRLMQLSHLTRLTVPTPESRSPDTTMPSPRPVRRAHPAPAVIAALLLTACAKPADLPIAARPVRVQPVVLAATHPAPSYTGAVHARIESDLAFRVGGKVVKRRVELGQQVRAGAVIAELDTEDYALGVAAALNQQQAAAVDAEQAATDAARFGRLLAQGAVSAGDAERQRARADTAHERLEQARRQVELTRHRAAYAVLQAPFDGVVTAVRIEVGQVVAEGQPVATLAGLGEREIVIDIAEANVLQARDARAATAALRVGDGRRFPVRLRELSPVAAAATGTYRARYRLGPDAPALALGMTATVWLDLAPDGPTPQAVATLPASALHHAGGQPAVWTVNAAGGPPTLVPVQVARYGQDEVQVTGVPDGALVVTAGVQKLDVAMNVVAVDADGNRLAAAAALSPDRQLRGSPALASPALASSAPVSPAPASPALASSAPVSPAPGSPAFASPPPAPGAALAPRR